MQEALSVWADEEGERRWMKEEARGQVGCKYKK